MGIILIEDAEEDIEDKKERENKRIIRASEDTQKEIRFRTKAEE